VLGKEVKKQNGNRGFTLIELIAVVAILAILMAIALPSYFGYVEKAREAAAVSECGSVVRTASMDVIVLSMDGVSGRAAAQSALNGDKTALLRRAGAAGELLEDLELTDGLSVAKAVYESARGVVVTYTRGASPEYAIGHLEGGFGGSDAPSYLSSLSALLSGQTLTSDYISSLLPSDEYPSLYRANGQLNWSNTSDLMQMYYQYVNGGTYAAAAADTLPQVIGDFPNSAVVDAAWWVPVYTTDGEVAMVACTKSSYSSGPLASYVIFCDGEYYYNTSGNGSQLQTNYLTDHNLNMDTLAASWKHAN